MIGGLLAVLLLIWQCPLDYLLGIPCPCCGMTRAFKSMVSLDLMASLSYHPLMLPTGAAIWYLIHRNVLPERFKLSRRAERTAGITLLVLLAAVYIYRIGFHPDSVVRFHTEDGLLFKFGEIFRK